MQYHFRVTQADVGVGGFVTGGTVLEWIDKAANAVAVQWSGGSCVAASVGTFHLDRPIGVGELVDVHAGLVYTGRSSMHILVTICSFDPRLAGAAQSAQCPVVFVATDPVGNPVEVPSRTPVTMLDLQRHRQARVRIRMRKCIEEAMVAQRYTAQGTASRATLRFRAARTDVDPDGNLRAGRLMRWIDDAVCACGTEWTGAQAITAYIAGIRLCRPIFTADVVEITARIIHTGPRSIHTAIRVAATDANGGQRRVAAHGLVVVVTLDDLGRALPVPQWEPASEEDHRLDRHARHVVELRRFVEPFTTAAVTVV